MKNNFAKKIFKISTIAFFSVFVFLSLLSINPQEVFSVQETPTAETSTNSTSYIDDEGNEQFLTDITTTHTYRNGTEAYKTINRTRTYTDSEGITHKFTNYFTNYNYADKSGAWSDEEEIKDIDDIDDKTPSKTVNKFTYTLLQSLPREGEDLKENVTLKEYLTWAFRFVLALAGFLAVMMIVIGGVEYIISGANESSRSDAKKRINNAISGLVLALVSYLVLYTINPSLVDFENNQFFKKKTTTSSSDGTFNGGGGGEFRGGGSSSSVATNVKDLQFDFSSSSDNTGGASGTW